MENHLAEHIAQFSGRKAKFLERKFLKFLRRKKRRETVKRNRTINKQLAID